MNLKSRLNYAINVMKRDPNFLKNWEEFELKTIPNDKKVISRVHKDVIAVLRAMGYKDLKYEKRIHYVPGTDILNTKSRMKKGFLLDFGIKCFNLNNDDWSLLKGFMEKEKYLKNKLSLLNT